MPSLSSLIVQRQVASIAEVEQAIARQVIHGGDLVTNLLEVSPQCEHSLTRVLAESLGIPSVPPGRLPAPDNDVLEIVPVETALRYGIFPLRLSSKTLVIATSERLKPTALHDLAYALNLDISQVAAPLIRIREGIAAHYGVPLEPRQLRLVQKLDGIVDGGSIPPRGQAAPLPTAPSILPSNLTSGVSSPPAALEPEVPTTRRKGSTLEMEEVRPPTNEEAEIWAESLAETRAEVSAPVEAERDPAPEPEPVLLPPTRDTVVDMEAQAPPSLVEISAAEPIEEPVAFPESDRPIEGEPHSFVSAPPPDVTGDSVAPPTAQSFPPGDSPRPPGTVNRRAVANLIKREVGSRRKSTAKSARKKGPFSRLDAERELEAARNAEDVCDTFFAFGSQFFEYSALFVVHGELIEGRDAWGPGADHLRVLGLGVPLDLPSSLATVRKEAHVLLSRFDELDLDRELVRDLDRLRARPPLGALVPLTVRNRAVAILYGDDGEGDVTLASLGDLLGFSALASSQIERIALAKKSKSGPFSGIVAPRAQPSSVEALARAFSLPMPQSSPPSFRVPTPSAGTPRTNEPRVSPGATSVHPPRPITNSWEDEDEVTLARKDALRVPKDPALAETEIPSFHIGRHSTAQGLGTAEARALRASPAAQSMDFGGGTRAVEAEVAPPPPTVESRAPASHSPPPVLPVERPTLETVVSRSSRPPEVQIVSPDVDVASDAVPTGRRSSARPFVPPIPRVDAEDASDLLAMHGGEGQEASAYRSEAEAVSRDGMYHLVPRPADARLRSESNELPLLLERAMNGGLQGEEALSELLGRAEQDFPGLIERFPGPLVVDRLRARADLPLASECGPLLKVVVMMRRAALPFMTVRSTSTDVDQRFWATHVLGELLLPEASNAILPRLFDEDVAVRRVARRAGQALAAAGAPGEPLKHSLANTMKNPEEPMQRRLLAIEALAEIRVPSIVPILIPALVDDSDGIIEAVRTALVVLTRQDLGRNPEVWEAWWELHRSENRVEWLIQSLTHDIPSIRRAAGDELKLVTREYFGYYDDLPPKERERAQARYAQWWKDEGQYRFR